MRKISYRLVGLIIFHLFCLGIFAQSINDASLADKFKIYRSKAIPEKLFIHTDREFYVAGEIIWFKIYYVNGDSHEPMKMSKIAYVEILNSNNEPVLQAKISLELGTGKGSLYLPASFNTGYYSFRAYTNWMKNFEASYFFEKKIAVANTLKNPDHVATADSVTFSANFFPEGGNLVNDITSKVGFMVASSKGNVHDFQGYITNRNNDTIASFAPSRFGLGHFYIKPEAGNSYKAIITLPNGTVINKPLPEAYDYGYAMNVRDMSNRITVTVKARKREGETNTEQVTLAGHTRQVLHVAEKAFLSNRDSAVWIIDKEKIGEGVTYLTLFNGNGTPVCERLLYKKPQRGIALNVNTDRPTYAIRQKISLALDAPVQAGILDLSASVFHVDTLNTQLSTIVDYMWLVSELGTEIESPEYYVSDDVGVQEAAENLMLTHGWRKFKWDDILKGGNAFIKFLPEINGHIVTGKIKDTRTDKPVANADAYLSIPGRPFGFYTSRSDKDGNLFFEIKKYYGNGQIIGQPGIETDSLYRVDINRPYVEAAPRKRYASLLLSESLKEQLLQRSIGMQAQNIYSGDSMRKFSAPYFYDTLPFFGTPSVSYKLDDYKRFTTMEEVLREYVREVGVGTSSQGLTFKMFNFIAHDFFPNNSLVLVDGVPLHNPNKIFAFDPLKVRRLDIVSSRYVLGRSTFNGLASFSTYDPGFAAFELDPKLVAIDYSGLQLHREFYSPQYRTKEQLERRIPDFRNTLYWSPDITTGKDGKSVIEFYSSDLPGKYRVIVQGTSSKGDLVSSQAVFEVK